MTAQRSPRDSPAREHGGNRGDESVNSAPSPLQEAQTDIQDIAMASPADFDWQSLVRDYHRDLQEISDAEDRQHEHFELLANVSGAS